MRKYIDNYEKIVNEKNKYRYMCNNCYHVIHIYPFEKISKKLCKYCGKYIFISKQEEFKYNIEKRMKI